MTNSRDILFKLVRLAMGWERDYTLPEDVNWSEVLDMAYEQGLSGIIIDGHENLTQKSPEIRRGLSLPENKLLLLQAIGQVPIIETTYNQHLNALKELGNVLQRAGVPFLLMKGFSCGQYYPVPKHRPCGDIDIFTGSCFEKSNEALHAAGIEVLNQYYRHTVSYVNEVMVENHRVLGDLRGPKRQTQDFEALLEHEANKCISSGDDLEIDGHLIPGAKQPSANFNMLFLPWHVSAHFAFERVTVRHLLDWALFLISEGKNINIEEFREAKKKYTFGYAKFADILTALSIKYLRIPTSMIPPVVLEDANGVDDKLVDKVYDYMFEGRPKERDKNRWKERWNNVRRIWKERWKYKELYGMSVVALLRYKVLGVLFRTGEND